MERGSAPKSPNSGYHLHTQEDDLHNPRFDLEDDPMPLRFEREDAERAEEEENDDFEVITVEDGVHPRFPWPWEFSLTWFPLAMPLRSRARSAAQVRIWS